MFISLYTHINYQWSRLGIVQTSSDQLKSWDVMSAAASVLSCQSPINMPHDFRHPDGCEGKTLKSWIQSTVQREDFMLEKMWSHSSETERAAQLPPWSQFDNLANGSHQNSQMEWSESAESISPLESSPNPQWSMLKLHAWPQSPHHVPWASRCQLPWNSLRSKSVKHSETVKVMLLLLALLDLLVAVSQDLSRELVASTHPFPGTLGVSGRFTRWIFPKWCVAMRRFQVARKTNHLWCSSHCRIKALSERCSFGTLKVKHIKIIKFFANKWARVDVNSPSPKVSSCTRVVWKDKTNSSSGSLSLSLKNFSRSVNKNATHICMRAMRHDQPVYLHYAMRFTVLLKGVAKRFVKENNVVVNGLWNADNRQRPEIQRVKKTKKHAKRGKNRNETTGKSLKQPENS